MSRFAPLDALFAAIRTPEYTGVNRCIPCTIVNLLIASIFTVAAFVVSPWLAFGGALIAVGVIWARGYLIPGTPALTRRYVPTSVLAWFDKVPPEYTPGEMDVEAILIEEGALIETVDGTDLTVAPEFRAGWTRRMRANDRDRDRASLAWLLGVDADRLTLKHRGEALVARLDGEWIGQWESRAAFVADVAAAAEFEARDRTWDALPTWVRSEVLGGLRLFLDRCPTCDGAVTLEQTVVKSCCRDTDVIALNCLGCGARLFETPIETMEISTLNPDVDKDRTVSP